MIHLSSFHAQTSGSNSNCDGCACQSGVQSQFFFVNNQDSLLMLSTLPLPHFLPLLLSASSALISLAHCRCCSVFHSMEEDPSQGDIQLDLQVNSSALSSSRWRWIIRDALLLQKKKKKKRAELH